LKLSHYDGVSLYDWRLSAGSMIKVYTSVDSVTLIYLLLNLDYGKGDDNPKVASSVTLAHRPTNRKLPLSYTITAILERNSS
jgi:hypothetical protein